MLVSGNAKIISLENYCDRKSFYNKCYVVEDGKRFYLFSYHTLVAKYEKGQFIRVWGGYSVTTMRHVNAFRKLLKLPTMSKREWEDLEV